MKMETAYYYGEPVHVPVVVADYIRDLGAERLSLYNRLAELEVRLGLQAPVAEEPNPHWAPIGVQKRDTA